MTAGLIVNNDSGALVVGSSYVNQGVVRKETLNLYDYPIPPNSTGSHAYQITYSGSYPIVAVRPLDATAATAISVDVYENSPGNFTITFMGGGPFTYWLFDTPNTVAFNYGLAVWNESGTLAFHTGYRYMQVKQWSNFNYAGGVFDSVFGIIYYSAVEPIGRQYAIAMNAPMAYIQVDDDTISGTAAVITNLSGVGLTPTGSGGYNIVVPIVGGTTSGYIYPAGAMIYSETMTVGSLLLLDVTGY